MTILEKTADLKQPAKSQNRRWTDRDPTLSMAVSLLQNLPLPQQEELSLHMLALADELYEPAETAEAQPVKPPRQLPPLLQVLFTRLDFPNRRILDNTPVQRLLKRLYPLPKNQQLDMAMRIINAAYWMDLEGDLSELEDHWVHELVSRTAVSF